MTKLIVAIDTSNEDKARKLVNDLTPWGVTFKFGMEFFFSFPDLVPANSFLDLKLHDIPNTVSRAVKTLGYSYSPSMLTVHAGGGQQMMSVAVEMSQSLPRP